MRAYTVSNAGAQPGHQDLEVPEPAPSEVRIRVTAASVNGFDVAVAVAVAAGYTGGFFEHRYPVVLGREFAGVVDALGLSMRSARASTVLRSATGYLASSRSPTWPRAPLLSSRLWMPAAASQAPRPVDGCRGRGARDVMPPTNPRAAGPAWTPKPSGWATQGSPKPQSAWRIACRVANRARLACAASEPGAPLRRPRTRPPSQAQPEPRLGTHLPVPPQHSHFHEPPWPG